MKTISVVNHKGGVGKTTTVMNLGAELAARGYRVLLVDFDAQGNLTTASGICGGGNIDDLDATVATALDELIEKEDEEGIGSRVALPVYSTDNAGRLDIAPCNIHMADVALKLNFMFARESYMKRLLSPIVEAACYDYCIIDNAPSIGVDFQNALVASDEVLIVLQPDTFSTDGMRGLFQGYRKVKDHFNPKLRIVGALINNCDTRTNFAKDMTKTIKDAWNDEDSDIHVFDTVIPRSIKVTESLAMRKSIRSYEPKSPVKKAFESFTDEYLEKEGR